MRCAVHSEPPRSIVCELPCQPHVQVIVCAWCLYSSITCLNGRSIGGLTGGRLFKGDLCTWTDGIRDSTGVPILPVRADPCRNPRSIGTEVVAHPSRQPAELAQHEP